MKFAFAFLLSVAAAQAAAPTIGFMLNAPLYLSGIQSAELSMYGNNNASNHFLNNAISVLFTTTNNKNPLPSGWTATAGMKWQSYAAFNRSDVNSAVGTIIYDDENWSQTPANEQTAPNTYTTDFASLAHGDSYKFMSTPARDLAKVQSNWNPSQDGSLDDYYLGEGYYKGQGTAFPPWASKNSDYYEIQGQADISAGNINTYLSFVGTAISEAIKSNASVKLFAGLSTTYGSETDWLNAVESTQTSAFKTSYGANPVGFWLNLTQTSGDYNNMAKLLHDLYVAGY